MPGVVTGEKASGRHRAAGRCCPIRSGTRSSPGAVNVPVGSFRPNTRPVDMSLKKPVYVPMISISPISLLLNDWIWPGNAASVSVVNVRLVVGMRTITPQARLKLYWKPTLYHCVSISLSVLRAAGARELPTWFSNWSPLQDSKNTRPPWSCSCGMSIPPTSKTLQPQAQASAAVVAKPRAAATEAASGTRKLKRQRSPVQKEDVGCATASFFTDGHNNSERVAALRYGRLWRASGRVMTGRRSVRAWSPPCSEFEIQRGAEILNQDIVEP